MSPPGRTPAERTAASRRTVLRGIGLAALAAATAGCGVDLGDVRWGQAPPVPAPTPGPDELARRRAVVTAQGLRAAVTTARAARSDLDALLGSLGTTHAAHLDALGPLPAASPTPAQTEPAPTRAWSASPTSPGPPSDPLPDPLPDLLAAELAGAAEALGDAAGTGGAAVDPGLARLLASVGAARVVHATLLAATLGQPAPAAPVVGEPVVGSGAVGSGVGVQSPDIGGDGAAAAVAAALDGEHAAVYTYGVVAARLSDGERERALASGESHRLLVERLSTWLVDGGLDAPPSAPAYDVPPLATPQDAIVLAAGVEDQVAVLDASLVAASTGGLRAEAVDLLVRRALSASAWRGTGTAFPGLPELA